jgi:hypothetical protein
MVITSSSASIVTLYQNPDRIMPFDENSNQHLFLQHPLRIPELEGS